MRESVSGSERTKILHQLAAEGQLALLTRIFLSDGQPRRALTQYRRIPSRGRAELTSLFLLEEIQFVASMPALTASNERAQSHEAAQVTRRRRARCPGHANVVLCA